MTKSLQASIRFLRVRGASRCAWRAIGHWDGREARTEPQILLYAILASLTMVSDTPDATPHAARRAEGRTTFPHGHCRRRRIGQMRAISG